MTTAIEEPTAKIEPKAVVSWCSTPPQGTPMSLHKFSLMDAIERASTLLRTDYSKDIEQLVIGTNFREIIMALPEFAAAGNRTKSGNAIKLGTLATRSVFLIQDKAWDNKAELRSSADEFVDINLLDTDYVKTLSAALELFQRARRNHPRLTFSIEYSDDSVWTVRLCDATGTGENMGIQILAKGQQKGQDLGSLHEALLPVIDKLHDLGFW